MAIQKPLTSIVGSENDITDVPNIAVETGGNLDDIRQILQGLHTNTRALLAEQRLRNLLLTIDPSKLSITDLEALRIVFTIQ